MLETPHVALGIAIATKIPNPWIAVPLAFASHFLLERIPHWNPHLNTETEKYGKPTKKSTIIVTIDVVISLILGFFVAYSKFPNSLLSLNILLCSFASVLPDIMEGPYFFLGVRNIFLSKWIKLQKSIQVDTNFTLGFTTQIITVIASLFWIFQK
ncbi:hypothetical protein A2422_00935 [Candidatus Woesebacteria bacterium RIFOXYC1_FULL_31_51]|uniref:Uncharacterized protein n=1 Tax=Candidatus Woesebacteria bacterium GW2011_GWC2_31_9 TaxID=1618586 RepID=A0A0G0AY22_9BACT|nr:MAG: hypothetical protein UR17_C0001G0636 [Candidatus Woesebacteria bacterium GW2011_GWF1_31_35]KKP22750.1 MAG: hypothetical protein UR11_C0002G0130 [Candidatus Woesebacteria bacterium GW2011_GWC1_30_29]KKP25867.1 MAG: hypothetical protein UR13_C0006G0006 [Candidatus Woesebacteria bacterium GW2011_GWD1_31_12]KKP27998.1 MAG: hypothetical protein UR16_C0001G0019 [Candidatus Woesebacteria bacterium GW2011_GWB1_31_29]KKP30440.1 MAG: hypothetical protein UR20_C0055G0006 [Candidatus Woesebacteria 